MDGKRQKCRLSIQEFQIDSLGSQRFSVQKQHIFMSLRQKKRYSITTNNNPRISNPELTDSMAGCELKNFSSSSIVGQIKNNTFFNLPLIKLKIPQSQEKVENDQLLAQNYSSAKWSRGNNYKINKNLSQKYHQKMELIKQSKEPTIAQKVFTITQMKNFDLDIVKKQTEAKSKVISHFTDKRPFHTSVHLQKFHIFKSPDQRIVPYQLQAKRIQRQSQKQQRINLVEQQFQEPLVTQPQLMKSLALTMKKSFKNKQHFSMQQKANRTKKLLQSFKIEGWQSDNPANGNVLEQQ